MPRACRPPDDDVARCEQTFAAKGGAVSPAQHDQLRRILATQLATAFAGSQQSLITVTHSAEIGKLLNYRVTAHHPTLAQIYEDWINTREPPYFGVHPDAKVLALVEGVTDAAQSRVLDIGAGTERNALALAHRGHPVDAVELTPKFADRLRQIADQESLPVKVLCDNVFQSRQALSQGYRLIVESEVVPDFRSVHEWRALLELAAQHLATKGQLVVNVFVTRDHYFTDDAAGEFAQQVYSFFLTPPELASAAQGLPLTLVSSENVRDYEQSHLPGNTGPPTSWYEDWISGGDIFDTSIEHCPVHMQWLVFEKKISP